VVGVGVGTLLSPEASAAWRLLFLARRDRSVTVVVGWLGWVWIL